PSSLSMLSSSGSTGPCSGSGRKAAVAPSPAGAAQTSAPDADMQAVAMVGAAMSYHRRERKAFWWAHFDRCENGPDTHQQDRNVFLVEKAEVLGDWWKDGARLPERRVKLTGSVSAGSDLREGSTWFRMYDAPLPGGLEGTGENGTGRNGWFGTEILELGHEDGKDTVVIRDKLRRNAEPYSQLPIALTEDQPIQTKSLEEALARLGDEVAAALPGVMSAASGGTGAPTPAPPGNQRSASIRDWTSSAGFRPASWTVHPFPCQAPVRIALLMPSRLLSRIWTTRTLPFRDRRERARHTLARTLSPGSCTAAGRWAWWPSPMPWSRTCCRQPC
ncbi:hypothetical protein AHiyo6_33960, partial [Arthrobacter sp. Hiyo6]